MNITTLMLSSLFINLLGLSICFISLFRTKKRDVLIKKISKQEEDKREQFLRRINGNTAHILGRLSKIEIQDKIAVKMAERAFNMASSANVAISILSRSISSRVPYRTRKQQQYDTTLSQQAEEQIGADLNSWLRPVLTDEELRILELADESLRTNGTKQ